MFKIVTWFNSIVFLSKKLENVKKSKSKSCFDLFFNSKLLSIKIVKWNHDLHSYIVYIPSFDAFLVQTKNRLAIPKQKIWWTTNYHNRPGWYCRMVLPSRFPRVKLYCTRSGSAEDKKSTLVAEPRSDRDIVLQKVPRNHFDQSF